jgi:hypothetical protein
MSESMNGSVIVAERVSRVVKVDIDIPTERFWVRDTEGNDAQVRVESGGKVYLCYTKDNRRTIESRELPWKDFFEKFKAFVDSIGE